MKTSELTGALLDYWVARAEGNYTTVPPHLAKHYAIPAYSTHWAHGGPLIDKYGLTVEPYPPAWWANEPGEPATMGEAPLEAICRAVVRAEFGDEVPDQENAK